MDVTDTVVTMDGDQALETPDTGLIRDNLSDRQQVISGSANHNQKLQVAPVDTRSRSVKVSHVSGFIIVVIRSPVTVQEWVAALPTGDDNIPDENDDKDILNDEIDNIKLGEEGIMVLFNNTHLHLRFKPAMILYLFKFNISAGYIVPGNGAKNFGQLLLQKNNKNLR